MNASSNVFAQLTSKSSLTHHDVVMRNCLRAGDLGRIIQLHGELYGKEQGWNSVFEAYVADGLARFVLHNDPHRDRIWIAEDAQTGQFLGCIGVVGIPDDKTTSQLRWFLLHPDARGQGLGRRLLETALSFCRQDESQPSSSSSSASSKTVFLWTVAQLPIAGHLYRSVGFKVTEEHTHSEWGTLVTEQRLELKLKN